MPEEVVRTPVGFKTIETGGAPARVVFPVFDDQLDGTPPLLAYQIFPGDDSAQIIILGRNLTGIVSVDASQDVNVAGNGGGAPVVGALIVTDTSIVVPLNGVATQLGDFWGIFLTDGDGNVYEAPSPVRVAGGV